MSITLPLGMKPNGSGRVGAKALTVAPSCPLLAATAVDLAIMLFCPFFATIPVEITVATESPHLAFCFVGSFLNDVATEFVVIAVPFHRDVVFCVLTRIPGSGVGSGTVVGVSEDGAGGKEKGGGLEGSLANERLGRQTHAVGCGDGFSPSSFDVGFLAQNGEEAFYVSPGLAALGRQELQVGQDMPKGGLLLSHRIDIFHHVVPFFFQPFFSLKASFSPANNRRQYSPFEKETSLFPEENPFFSRKFCLRIVLLFRLFQRKTRFFELVGWDYFPKNAMAIQRRFHRKLDAVGLVMIFRSVTGLGKFAKRGRLLKRLFLFFCRGCFFERQGRLILGFAVSSR